MVFVNVLRIKSTDSGKQNEYIQIKVRIMSQRRKLCEKTAKTFFLNQ